MQPNNFDPRDIARRVAIANAAVWMRAPQDDDLQTATEFSDSEDEMSGQESDFDDSDSEDEIGEQAGEVGQQEDREREMAEQRERERERNDAEVEEQLEQVKRRACVELREMFPGVDPDWIADMVQNNDMRNIVEFILNNEGDAQRVPKIEQKRRRLSEMREEEEPEPEPSLRRSLDGFVREASRDINIVNPVFAYKWDRMNEVERKQHASMVDALCKALRDAPPTPHLRFPPRYQRAKFDTSYPVIRLPFIRQLMKSCNQGEIPMFAVLISLDLILMGEQERLCREPVFAQFLEACETHTLKTTRDAVKRPFTKRALAPALAALKQGRSDPFKDWGNFMAGPHICSLEWDKVTALMTKDYLDLPKFTCEVCFDDELMIHSIECHSDEAGAVTHRFCFDCVQGQANACCEEGRVAGAGMGIPCLEVGCKGYITPVQLRAAGVKKQVLGRLEKRLEQETLSVAGVVVERCKYCYFGVYMEATPEEDKVFHCPNCSAQFCRLCQRDWEHHAGRPCDELCNAADEARKKLENELTAAMIHTCPRCQLNFEKETGCNKMTCRCGLTMCYVCRVTGIDYHHFCQHVRDPNSGACPVNCDHPCLLWQNVAKSLEQQRKELLDQARQNADLDEDMLNSLKL